MTPYHTPRSIPEVLHKSPWTHRLNFWPLEQHLALFAFQDHLGLPGQTLTGSGGQIKPYHTPRSIPEVMPESPWAHRYANLALSGPVGVCRGVLRLTQRTQVLSLSTVPTGPRQTPTGHFLVPYHSAWVGEQSCYRPKGVLSPAWVDFSPPRFISYKLQDPLGLVSENGNLHL